ncbi:MULTISPECIES: PKD-like domain-containing protein [Flavobacterium]|uniref:Gliding motility-associated C-terminal domain-containing protein n=1 Tax=Flavobacterium keumense TaxID=1306518 RepID=A0ABY8N4V5_9FLAO|nr:MULTISPECIES: PKD-like domain-containing protein [Flavobacterium]WGK94414.1 gliding motility-associated C-terminal domain-containing protein [Flavobacterium keumense]
MKKPHKFQSVLFLLCLLVGISTYSKELDYKSTTPIVNSLVTPTVSSFSPTEGYAGTMVTITGTDFTSTSVVKIGTTIISSSNITFVSSTELKVVIPCDITSGVIDVDGGVSTSVFTYQSAVILNLLPDLSYCVGVTVPAVNLVGAPSGVVFSWTNTNSNIGLATSGTGAISTFTATNTTAEPISGTIEITPSINGCVGISKSYTVTINPKPIANSITTTTVCEGTTINDIVLSAASPLNGSGTSFTWSSTNSNAIGLSQSSGNTSPIPSFTANNLTNSLVASVFTVTPTYQGCVGNSVQFTVNVEPDSVAGTISGPSTTCFGTAPGVLTLNNNVGSVIKWQSSSNDVAWTDINASTNTYSPGILTANTYFRAVVTSGSCTEVTTPSVLITVNALPVVNAGLDQTVCYGSSVTLVGSGATTYTWNNGVVNTVAFVPSSTTTYTVTGIGANGCAATDQVVVTVNPIPSAPSATAQTFLVSQNKTVGDLLITSSGTPIWYNSASGGSLYTSSALLTTGTYYAAQKVNGCESTARTAVAVSVFSDSVGGSVSGSTTVCSGANSTVLTISGYTGSIKRWQSSTVSDFSANVTDITVVSANYTVTNLTSPLYFRAVVQSGTTTEAFSSPAFIDVTAPSNGGVLTATNSSVCKGISGGLLTLGSEVGNVVNWQQSINNGATWVDIPNTSTNYNAPALTDTTQYRVEVKNGICSSSFSNVVTIVVKDTPTVTDIPNQSICLGSTKTFGDVFVAGNTYSLTSDLGYSSATNQSTILFNTLGTQVFTYIVTNTASGCTTQDQFEVTTNPLPSATVIANTTICQGTSIAIGGTSVLGSTYSWSSNPIGFSSTNSNPTVSPTVTTTYTLEETISATSCRKVNAVVVTVQTPPVVTIVGAPQYHVCETTNQIQLQSSVSNYTTSSIVWSKVIGTGSFDFTNILNPKYTPSISDIAAGSVKLRITVTGLGACTQTYSEDLVIIIDKKPIANAGLDVATCGTSPIQLDGSVSQNAFNYIWTLPTNVTGTLNTSDPAKPIYTPSTADVSYSGPITITLEATSNSTCASTFDTVDVLITPAPVVNAGPPTTSICEGSNYIVPSGSASVQNVDANTIIWTKGTGDGTLVSATSLTPIYIPGPNDIATGSVTLKLSASGNNACSTPVSDNLILNIVKEPVVNAGADITVCEGSINVAASIQNAGTIQWTTSGGGYFIDPTASSPIYIPSNSDLNSTVTLTVTVTPLSPCGTTKSDSVLYRINAKPTVVAGGDVTICQTTPTYQLQSTVTNSSSITWTSTGSGTFDNIHNEDPVYTLSPNDIVNGSVTFTVTTTQAGCTNAQDTMVLTIQKNPVANAGLAQVICQGDSVVLPGSATNASSVNWVRSGGTGSFINDNTTNPTYTSTGSESGVIYLTLEANAIAPCTISSSSETTITIVPKPTADAGSNAQICEGETYTINNANATNYVGLQWSTNGDGTFTGGNTLTPTYTPGISDKSNGSVVLTLVATKNFPCNANAVDQMTLVINKVPSITVINPDVNLCVNSGPYTITGVVPVDYDTLSWTTTGTGTFSSTTTATPIYSPSAADYTLGTVKLKLTASRNPLNCNSSTFKEITLHFISKPTVDAGPLTAEICQGFSYVTNSATASNYSNVTWSTSGTGTFINATTLLASYTPSASDYNAGFVILTLSANPIAPCSGPITDTIRLNLQKTPVITVPADTSICVNQNTFSIGGVSISPADAYDTNSIVWTTTGTGTFSPSGDALNPIYNPSTDDIAAGFVNLKITVNPIAPCVTSVSNTFKLSFQKLPVATAGANLTRCALPFQITSATADLTTVNNLVWTTNGTGTFDYSNIIDPIYTPSAADILSGSVILTLTANPIAPCAIPSVSNFTLTLIKSPIVNVVTPQAAICEDATNILVAGTTVANVASYNWTSTTGTTISNANSLTPLVTPSATDITNGYIDVTITAIPNAPCSTSVLKTVRIPIQKKPILSAGASQTICEGSVITTSDAIATQVTNLKWTKNGGDGSFSTSDTSRVVEYIPGPNEIASGKVVLTLTGDAIAPCVGTISSTVEHLTVKNPVITVNPTQVTICETDTYQVPLSQINVVNPTSVASVQWTTTNASSLTGSTTFTPIYTPSAVDIATGYANLVLTVTPIAPCATPIVKTIRVNIAKKATIDATQPNYTFCENTAKQLTASFANHNATTIQWRVVSGAGTLSAANTATPIYTPDPSSTTVVLEVSVSSILPCAGVTTKQITLNVIKKPVVTFAKTTDTICNSQTSYALNGNSVGNATASTTYLWTTTGTGTFDNNTALVTTYNFSAADLLNNSVTLRLLAKSDALCALTDYKEIVITIKPAPTVNTIPSETICEGSVFTATAIATNESSVLWTTVGTSNGTFTNANSETATYVPGTNDTNGFTLQFTAIGDPVCALATTTKTVTIQKLPTVDAGVENRNNCSNEPFQITGVIGQNTGTITWSSNSSSGVNRGTFSNPSVLNPIYTPSAAEIAAGTPITLTVTVNGVSPCTNSVSDFIVLHLDPKQVVNAGLDQTICEGATISLAGAVTHTSSVNWTSSSSGTSGFVNPNSATTTYQPNATDILNGTVTLTLHGLSDSNCPEVVDTMVVTIVKKPTANAGVNITICEGTSYTLVSGDATAQNYSSLTWTATGPGTLDASTIHSLTPRYNPAPGQVGTVTLTMTAEGYSQCGVNAISSKTITIIASPSVSVPSTRTICQGQSLTLTTAEVSATNYAALAWTSSNGLGSFAPSTSLATVFTPTTTQSGTVNLRLTATALNAVCTNAFAEVAVTIVPSPIVNAGVDASICQTGTHTISGASVPSGSVFNWTISGPATISAGTETTLTPVVVPNPGSSGTVTLTLTVQGAAQCPTPVSDTVTVTIFPSPTVDAGSNQTACEGIAFISLNGTASNGINYTWTTDGAGTIQTGTNPLQAKYIPDPTDYANSSGVNTITMYLTAGGVNGCSQVVDSMTVTLYSKPKVFAGIDQTVCQGTTVSLGTATASNFSTVTWTTSGNGAFNYSGSNGGIRPSYVLGSNDLSTVTLTISAMPNANCSQVAVTDQVVITVHKNPTIVASSNEVTMCAETFTLPDVITVNDANSIIWTNTTGMSTVGTIVNGTSETPLVTPTIAEIANGFVLLTVTAQPLSGCSTSDSEVIKVNLIPKAIVNAGTDAVFCQGTPIVVNSNASVTNSTNYYWTENGTGTIKASTLNTLSPEYIPGTNETGIITLTLHATNSSPCTSEVTDTMTVTINPQPTVTAGPDATICETSTYNLVNATAANYDNLPTNLEWVAYQDINRTTLATGTFSNVHAVNPTYVPSAADIALGKVYLTLKVASTSCGTLVTDTMELTIAQGTGVNAGVNASICEGSTFTLSQATADNVATVSWTSSQNSNGTSSSTYQSGVFSDSSILKPVYTPSADDSNLGYVYLKLTGVSNSTCPANSSVIRLDIVKKPTVAASDVQMCVNSPQITLNGTATNYQSVNWSVLSGPGSIIANSANPLNPTYSSGLSINEPTNKTAVVRLFVTPKAGCPSSAAVYEDVTINIQALPIVEAGVSGSTCYITGQPIAAFSITGTEVTNGGTQNWTTSAAGTFTLGNPVLYNSFSNSCTPEVLTLTVNGVGACSTSSKSDSVTLAINCSAPNLGTISSSNGNTICQSETATVTYTVPANPNVLTYNWSIPSGATLVSGQNTNTITVRYGIGSLSGTISVYGANGCGNGSISTFPITVNALPTATSISGQQQVCAGASGIVYTALAMPNATSYTWTLPNGSTVTTVSNTISINYQTTDVSGNLSVVVNNSCGAGPVSANYPITVVPKPTFTSNLTPAAVCSGALFDYVPTSSTTGVTFSWTRATQSGIANVATNSNGNISEALVNTTSNSISVVYQYTMQGAAPSSCTNVATVTVTINPTPSLTSPSSVSSICSGTVFSYTPTSNVSGTISWTRASVSGISESAASGTGSISEMLTNTSSSSKTVVYTITLPVNSFGCSKTYDLPIVVNSLPTATISGSTAICRNSTNPTITFTGANGVAPYIFTYKINGGNNQTITTTSGNTVSLNVSSANSGSFVYTLVSVQDSSSSSCSQLQSGSATITVNALPVLVVNAPTPVCAPNTVDLTAVTTGSDAGLNYTYWKDSLETIPYNTPSLATAGTYYIKATNSNGCTDSKSVTVYVNPLPTASISGTTEVCKNSGSPVVTFAGANGTPPYTFTYTINGGANQTITTSNGSTASISVATVTPGVYNYNLVSVRDSSSSTCTQSQSGLATITVNPLPTATISGTVSTCVNATNPIVTFTGANGTAPYTFIYSINGGANQTITTATGNSVTLPVVTSTAGIFTYNLISVSDSSSTACSQSQTGSATVTINPLPTLIVTNPAEVCVPNTIDLTATTTGSSSGLTYSYWNDNATTIAIVNPTSISASGTYFIKGTDANGCFIVKPVVAKINPLPTATISGTTSYTVCQNASQPLVVFSGANATPPYVFQYRINSGAIQTVSTTATSSTVSVAIPTSTVGNYTVTLVSVRESSASACSNSSITLPNQAFVTVEQGGTVTPQNAMTVSQTVCQGSPINPAVFAIGGSASSAFVTNLPTGVTGVYNATSRTITISGSPTTTGVFSYVIHTAGSVNGCDSTFNGTLTINADDTINILTPTTVNQKVCACTTIQPIVYNLGGGATGGDVVFSPHAPSGLIWSIASNTLTISGSSCEVGTFTYTVQSYGICDPTTYTGTIEIVQNATVSVVSGNPNTTVCIGNSFAVPVKFAITPATETMVLKGTLPTGVTFNPSTGILSGTPTQSGSFSYVIDSSTSCGTSISGTITVNPVQSISLLSGATSQIVCINSAINPTTFTVAPGVTSVTINPPLPNGITLSLNTTAGIVTISGTPTVATSLPQNYTITTQGGCGTSASTSIFFDIKPAATITFISNSSSLNQAVCQNGPIVPIQFTVGGGATGIENPILPAGLTISFDAATAVYTIQGNPTVNGTFTIPITTTGCSITENVVISNVNSAVSVNLISATGTDNQTVCQTNFNTAIVPIKYTIVGATGVTLTGLPAGVSSSYDSETGELLISGIPTRAGIFNYTITTLPCSSIKTGVLKVSTPMTITNESVTNVTCSTAQNGAISVTIVGGVTSGGLYAVHWSGPNGFQQNQTNITGLEAGNYTLSGTDAIGCPLPTKTYTVQPAQPIVISLVSTTNVTCNGSLGCANFNYTGGSGIYTQFVLKYLDPSSQALNTVVPLNNNYFNICNLKAGLYYLTVTDSNNCTTEPYLFTIYDYSTLKIDSVSLDTTLCANTAGKVRVSVSSLDSNLTFYYNNSLVSSVDLGNNVYEISIANPTTPTGIIKVMNSQNCWDTKTINTAIVNPQLSYTSLNLTTYGNVSVNESVKFTNGLTVSNIPAEYEYIVWDFGDNSPPKVFYNPKDILPNSSGESITTVYHTYAIDGLYPVTLTVYNQFGCSRSITEIITVGQGAGIMLPTAFSPNNDGINDLFRPSLLGLKEVSMYIYDNWGNLVYEISSDTASLPSDWGWNGVEKVNSEPVNGTYRYYIMAKTINDKIIEKEGHFILIK